MRWQFILVAVLVLVLATGFTLKGWQNQMAEGNQKLVDGQIEESIQAFNQALIDAPDEPGIHYNLGNALYSVGDYSGAKDQYTKALELNEDQQLRENIQYNLGNIEYRLGESLIEENPQEALNQWEIALQQFQQVIQENPTDEDAKFNYEFVKEKIEDLKEQMEEQQENQDQQQDGDQENQDEQQNQQNQEQDQNQGQNQQQNQQGDQQQEEEQQQQQNGEDQQEDQSAANENEEQEGQELEKQQVMALTAEEALQLLEQFKEQNGEFIPMKPEDQKQSGSFKDW